METVVDMPAGAPETEVLAKAQRRRFSAEYKRRIVKERNLSTSLRHAGPSFTVQHRFNPR